MLRISKELLQDRMNMNGFPTRKLLMQLLEEAVLIRAEYLILEAIMTRMGCPIEEENWTSSQLIVLTHSLSD
jgi:hypothetical protein